MRTLRRTVPPAVAFAVLVFLAETATAAETATIVNDSDMSIEMYRQWSHIPCESGKIVLAPGERVRHRGPDGAVLHVRFNSTPNVTPAREVTVQIITASTEDPSHPGFVSYFRNQTPHVVAILDL